MKRAVAIPLLLLANIFLLAHAVIPHHHHNQIPVALTTPAHEHNGGGAQGHNHCGDEVPVPHNGTGHESGEECFLETGFEATENRQYSESCSYCPHTVVALVAFHNPIPEVYTLDGDDIRPKPPVLTYRYEYSTRSLGLRAPPVC